MLETIIVSGTRFDCVDLNDSWMLQGLEFWFCCSFNDIWMENCAIDKSHVNPKSQLFYMLLISAFLIHKTANKPSNSIDHQKLINLS